MGEWDVSLAPLLPWSLREPCEVVMDYLGCLPRYQYKFPHWSLQKEEHGLFEHSTRTNLCRLYICANDRVFSCLYQSSFKLTATLCGCLLTLIPSRLFKSLITNDDNNNCNN